MLLYIGVLARSIPAEIPRQVKGDQHYQDYRSKDSQSPGAMLPFVHRARIDLVDQISFGGLDDHFIGHAVRSSRGRKLRWMKNFKDRGHHGIVVAIEAPHVIA